MDARRNSQTPADRSSRSDWGLFGLCFSISMLDGYDTQLIAYCAPSLSQHLHIPVPYFGVIFSAGLAGSMAGSAVGGWLADRYGRRRLILITVLIFGLATLATVTATSAGSLVTLRMIAGVGLGGALPNFIAMAAEAAPLHMRTRFIGMTLWGFPIGAGLGGLLSLPLIEHYGTTGVFLAGGSLPLLLLPVLYARLPESRAWEADRCCERADVAGHRERAAARKVGFRVILGPEFRLRTLSLSLALSFCLLLSYLLVSWIPLLLKMEGLDNRTALAGTVVLNLGGVAGSFIFTRWVDTSARPLWLLAGILGASPIAVAFVAAGISQVWIVLMSLWVVGMVLIGGQMTLSSFASTLFPNSVRATAVGFIQATGRIGALLGPLVASLLVTIHLPLNAVLGLAGLAGLLGAAALWPIRHLAI